MRASLACILIFWILAIIPPMLSWFGIFYLPSEDPLILSATVHWVLGILVSLPIFFKISKFLSESLLSQKRFLRFSKYFTLALLIPLITALSANVTLGATLPMMHTAILGEKSEVQYVVSKGDARRYAWLSQCESGLGVETRVFGHNRLCGWRHKGFRKGSIITVSGKASRAGVFYKSSEPRPGLPPE